MKRFAALLLIAALIALAVPTAAVGGTAGDRATGHWVIDQGGGVIFEYYFDCHEAVGTPGTKGYRPEKGSLTLVQHPWLPLGTYPVTDVVVSGNVCDFMVMIDGFNYHDFMTDNGEPGVGVDTYTGLLLTAGNLQVHNYPYDGD